jgi:signal peptidase I
MEVPKKRQKSLLREYVDTAVYAVVLTLLLRVFVVQAFRIPSGSMLETLQIGDFLFVNKFEYGAKIPFTDWRLPGIGQPEPGHVIVFQYPQDPSKDYIKRCVATGGQTIQMRDKILFRDGVQIDEEYAVHGDPQIRPAEYDTRDNFGPTTVPANALFMLGDNRDYSHDSRYWGQVDFELVKGRAMFIYWSWNRDENWPRFNRLFKAIR